MPEPDSLSDLVTLFAEGIPLTQTALDEDWVQQRDQFLACIPQGFPPSLALSAAPQRMQVSDSSLTVSYTVQKSEETTAALKIRLLNLGYERRFAKASYASQQITIHVVQHSLEGNRRG